MTRVCTILLALAAVASAVAAPYPVIIDTDIGSYFDDSAAIALALSRPELDVKMVLTATGNVTARAKIVAKYLTAYGRSDIPIGIGVANDNVTTEALFGWAADEDLAAYPGGVFADGVGKAVEVVAASPDPVRIIAIAPADNFPHLLARGGPDFVRKCSVYAMSGSIFTNYWGAKGAVAEYNAALCAGCTRAMYTAGWKVTTTPLDTCGVSTLLGAPYNDLLADAKGPMAPVLMQSLLFQAANGGFSANKNATMWCDPVAVYLALPENPLVSIELLHLDVTPSGYTVQSPHGAPIQVALSWRELAQFEAWVSASIRSFPAAPART